MKKCIKCDIDLDETNTTWYRAKNYIHKCNGCTKTEKREQQAARRSAMDPREDAARSLRYLSKLREMDPVKYTAKQMASSAKKRSKVVGGGYDLSTDYVLSLCVEKCPILGDTLKYGGGEKSNLSASLDRIDSAKGYTIGNVQVVSLLANLMKSSATRDQLERFADWVNSTK